MVIKAVDFDAFYTISLDHVKAKYIFLCIVHKSAL